MNSAPIKKRPVLSIRGFASGKGYNHLRIDSLDSYAEEFWLLLCPPKDRPRFQRLIDCLSGKAHPQKGVLKLMGSEKADLAHLHFFQQTGDHLLSRPELSLKNLLDAVRFVLKSLGVKLGQRKSEAIEIIGRAGLSDWTRKPFKTLDFQQKESLLLCLASRVSAPLWLLCDPFECFPYLKAQVFLKEVTKAARSKKATLIIFASSPEAAFHADFKVAAFYSGNHLQTGTAIELYRRPRTVETAQLMGPARLFAGKLESAWGGQALVSCELGQIHGFWQAEGEGAAGEGVRVLIRPEAWHLDAFPADENGVEVQLRSCRYQGQIAFWEVSTPEGKVFELAEINTHRSLDSSGSLYAWVAPEDVSVFKGA